MSTLLSYFTVEHGSRARRNARRKGIKVQDDGETLRDQRIKFKKALSQSKRDQILEARRNVMEKINWTTAFDDDNEDSDEELKASNRTPEDLILEVGKIVQSGEHIQLGQLEYCLNLIRLFLNLEMRSKLGSVETLLSQEPGTFAVRILSTDFLHILTHLFKSSLSSPSSHSLDITRQVSSILKEVTSFIHSSSVSVIDLSSIEATLLDLCLHTLTLNDGQRVDLICQSNAFAILQNLLDDCDLQATSSRPPSPIVSSSADFVPVMATQVCHHLNYSINIYGPDDKVVNQYIKTITSFMSIFLKHLLKSPSSSDWISVFMTSTSSQLRSLLLLNDEEVTQNVLKFIRSVVEMRQGSLLIINHAMTNSNENLIPTLIDIYLSKMSHRQSCLEIIAIISVSCEESVDFVRKFLSDEKFIASLPWTEPTTPTACIIRALACIPEVVPLLMTYGLASFVEDSLYWGEIKTQEEVIRTLEVLSNRGLTETIWILLSSGSLIETLSERLLREGVEIVSMILNIFFEFIRRLTDSNRQEFVSRTAHLFYPPLKTLFEAKHQVISARVADLLEIYSYAPSEDEGK